LSKKTIGILETSVGIYDNVMLSGTTGYIIFSARSRVSLVTAKDSRGQKSFSCDMVVSIGPQKTGIIKRQGIIHNTKIIAVINFTDFIL
jgi:hypothetical protein